MGAVVEQGALEGWLQVVLVVVVSLEEWEVQEILAVLEAEVEAAEMLEVLQVLQQEKVLVMVQQEVMAEVEGAAAIMAVIMKEVLVAAALVVLD